MDLARYEHVSEATFHELASCDFVRKRQNIVMVGNTGRGKTHCSIALGIKACMQGMNVKFYTAANALLRSTSSLFGAVAKAAMRA